MPTNYSRIVTSYKQSVIQIISYVFIISTQISKQTCYFQLGGSKEGCRVLPELSGPEGPTLNAAPQETGPSLPPPGARATGDTHLRDLDGLRQGDLRHGRGGRGGDGGPGCAVLLAGRVLLHGGGQQLGLGLGLLEQ